MRIDDLYSEDVQRDYDKKYCVVSRQGYLELLDIRVTVPKRSLFCDTAFCLNKFTTCETPHMINPIVSDV